MSDLIWEAKERIKRVRMQDVEVSVTHDGQPIPNALVSADMQKHGYLFGAVCYMYGKYPEAETNEKFTKEFTKLFNYTMVPYHWNWYEPRRHEYAEPYTGNLVRWADQNGLKKKLHALIWHECCPDWIQESDDVEALYTERITHLMRRYGDSFDFFDAANETTVNDRFQNPVSRWVRNYGPMNMLKYVTKLVRSFRPDAKLIYGDWNVHVEEYYQFLREMRENDIDINLIGIQSHMHSKNWTWEETMRIMDRAAEFGWPIHFPECSICSGKPIHAINHDPGAINEFIETEDDLYFQAEYAKDFYTLVFSHPATEALSWFDFTDHRWLGAPAGVVTDKLEIKPVYKMLDQLINQEWRSNFKAMTNSEGIIRSKLFFGNYNFTVDVDGKRTVCPYNLERKSFYEGNELRRIVLRI